MDGKKAMPFIVGIVLFIISGVGGIFIGISVYILYLIVMALRVYIDKNKSSQV